jgi:hypothetical protein
LCFVVLAALLACLALLPVATQWLIVNPWILNNEHLAPFDYVSLLMAGELAWADVTHARIPSIWPDYAFAFTSLALAGWRVKAFVIYWFLQFFVSVFGLSCLGFLFSGRRGSLLTLFSLSGLVGLVYGSSQFRDLIFQSGIPARHGGSWLNFCVLVLLFAFLARPSISKPLLWIGRLALFALVMVGVFSNRLLLIQFVLPLGLVLLCLLLLGRFKGAHFERFSSFASFGVVLLGSLIGYLQYILSFRQCSEMGVGSASAFSMLVEAFRSGQVILLPVLLVGLGFAFVFIGFVSLLRADSARSYLGWTGIADVPGMLLFLGFVVGFGALAYFQLDLDLANRAYWRYLIVPAYASLFSSALVIILLMERLPFGYFPWLERKAIGLESLAGFAVVPASLLFAVLASVSVESVSRSYVSVYGPQDSWLNSLLARTGLTAKLGFVADPPWESRRLSFVSEGAISALSVSSDGNPLIYPHSRLQFITKDASVDPMSPRSNQVLSPSWVLASPQDYERMKAFYGEPLHAIGCFEQKGCLYRFDPAKVDKNTSVFLSTWHSERYGCLKGRMEKIRSIAINGIRKFPWLGPLFVGR